MSVTQFYSLRYCELVLILKGRADRHKNEARIQREESAWIVSWLLLPHKKEGADPITPAQLMGKKSRGIKGKAFASDEDAARAYIAALKRKSKKR